MNIEKDSDGAQSVAFELDMNRPLDAGKALTDSMMPILTNIASHFDDEQRHQFATGFLCSIAGIMAAIVGPDHARSLIADAAQALAEAQTIDAEALRSAH